MNNCYTHHYTIGGTGSPIRPKLPHALFRYVCIDFEPRYIYIYIYKAVNPGTMTYFFYCLRSTTIEALQQTAVDSRYSIFFSLI